MDLPGSGGVALPLHEHDWRIVSVSQEDFVEVVECRCLTCLAVSFT